MVEHEINVPIVIDNGSGYVRVGYSHYDNPLSIFDSEILLYHSHSDDHSFFYDADFMERTWTKAFSELRLKDISENPVILTEPPHNPKDRREKMIQIMFEKFNVPSFHSTTSEMLSLFATGRTTGWVLSSGFEITRAVPICDGDYIKNSIKSIDVAGNQLSSYIRNHLSGHGHTFNYKTDFEVIDDIKKKYSYVALDYEAELQKSKSGACDIVYQFPDISILALSQERFTCPEILFKPQLFGFKFDGIKKMLSDSISECPRDIHTKFFSNVVLNGGTTMFKGFPERIKKEITDIAPDKSEIDIVAYPDRSNLAWLGGSILGCLENFDKLVITKEKYNEYGPQIIHSYFPNY